MNTSEKLKLFDNKRTEVFFLLVVSHAKAFVWGSLVLILIFSSFLTTLTKDVSSDSFINKDNPALVYKNKIKDTFGLTDPMVIAIYHEDTIYNSKTINLIDRLTRSIEKISNIDPERVVSITNANNIYGTFDGMVVEPFLDLDTKLSDENLERVKNAVKDFPLYIGTLVSADSTVSVIVAEVMDTQKAGETYDQIIKLTTSEVLQEKESIHVAGEGAVAGYLGSYIDRDAQRLNPIAALVISLILFIAYRNITATLLPNIIVLATVSSALGIMAGFGVPFFVVTNGLVVILIGIAVADSIHIFCQYFEERENSCEKSTSEIVVNTMLEMWRPITLTSITTIAGFMGLYLASEMPPFKYLGLFSALGVAIAWLYSMVFLPAALSLIPIRKGNKTLNEKVSKKTEDISAKIMSNLGRFTVANSKKIVFLFVLAFGVGIYGVINVTVNENRIGVFNKNEPIYKADNLINLKLNGSNNLDIVIETPETEDLFKPENLLAIEKLQEYVESLPMVGGSVSVVDYIKQMNKALNEGDNSYYKIPDDQDLIAQLFLLYSLSGDPTDFEEEIDYEYRTANIRVNIKSGMYLDHGTILDQLNQYISKEFNKNDERKATLSGRVEVNHTWVSKIGESHFKSVAFALCLVFLMASLVFGSFSAGFLALLPVMVSIMIIYAVMVFNNIWLGIGTSMFASIAIGLGVDFAIHTMDRVKQLSHNRKNIEDVILALYPNTGRALLFNFLAIGFGFGTLMISEVVPLVRFGGIVLLAVAVSFFTSMTLLPAILNIFKPNFLGIYRNNTTE